jgi:hypothetical protein
MNQKLIFVNRMLNLIFTLIMCKKRQNCNSEIKFTAAMMNCKGFPLYIVCTSDVKSVGSLDI